jgi:uncharacterized protein
MSGSMFTIGLLLTGLSDPAKVQAFFAMSFWPFDLRQWDPSLLLVMLFATAPNIISIQWRGLQDPPRLATKFNVPTKTLADVDMKFYAGAVAFGVGWGSNGVCPGPAIIRALLQPIWGITWFAGFYIGSLDIFGS